MKRAGADAILTYFALDAARLAASAAAERLARRSRCAAAALDERVGVEPQLLAARAVAPRPLPRRAVRAHRQPDAAARRVDRELVRVASPSRVRQRRGNCDAAVRAARSRRPSRRRRRARAGCRCARSPSPAATPPTSSGVERREAAHPHERLARAARAASRVRVAAEQRVVLGAAPPRSRRRPAAPRARAASSWRAALRLASDQSAMPCSAIRRAASCAMRARSCASGPSAVGARRAGLERRGRARCASTHRLRRAGRGRPAPGGRLRACGDERVVARGAAAYSAKNQSVSVARRRRAGPVSALIAHRRRRPRASSERLLRHALQRAAACTLIQIGSAATPPVSLVPSVFGWSKPIHATPTSVGVVAAEPRVDVLVGRAGLAGEVLAAERHARASRCRSATTSRSMRRHDERVARVDHALGARRRPSPASPRDSTLPLARR